MAAAADTTTGDPFGGCDSACSTPFVSAPSSPSRDGHHAFPFAAHNLHGACFFSAPASPTRGGGGSVGDFSAAALDFDFDFSSRFPSPSRAEMSTADELFHNGQIRPVRLAAALLQPQHPTALTSGFAADAQRDQDDNGDRCGRVRSRSVRRKARSMSPFRAHWRRSPSPAPATQDIEPADEPLTATPAASRSSSSSSTASSASSASSSSSRGSRRWGFIKDLLHRSKSDGGKTHHHHSTLSPAPTTTTPVSPATPATTASKRAPSPSPSPAATARARGAPGRGGRRRSAHERLYEARRAEAEEMRRRTYLPYRQGLLLFGCIGLGNRSGAVHGLARGLNAVSSRS